MNTDRRGFLSLLIGGGATLTAVGALLPEAHAVEVKRDRQYVFVLKGAHLSQEATHNAERILKERGINAVVVVSGFDIDIYEVNQP